MATESIPNNRTDVGRDSTYSNRTPARVRGVATVVIASALSLTALQAPAIAHANVQARSAPSFNLFIPGTWETSESHDPWTDSGMLAPVADTIRAEHGDSAIIYFLPYMARAFDNGHSYADSEAAAVAKASEVLREYAARYPEAEFTITGFSQGAHAAGDLAAAIGNGQGPIPAHRVLAVGLLADPAAGTAGAAMVGPTSRGIGITGPRRAGMGTLTGRVVSICAPKDLYCSIDSTTNPVLDQIGAVLGTARDEAAAAVDRAASAAEVLENLTSTNFAGIADNLVRLQQALTASDLNGVHRIAGTVNSQLNPLVRAAAAVDWQAVSTVLAHIPDGTGFTEAAAAMAAALARIDIERAAELVGEIQELAWTGIAAVAPRAGAVTVPEMPAVTLADLRRLVGELGAITADLVDGSESGAKQPLSKLGRLAVTVASIVKSNAITNPAALVKDAVAAAEFARSNSHTDYGSFVVDGAGHSATQWLGSWLCDKITEAEAEAEARPVR